MNKELSLIYIYYIQDVPKKRPLRIFSIYCIFPKLGLNYIISCISTPFENKLVFKSYSKKVTGPSIFAKLLIAAGDVKKKYSFFTNFRRKILTI